MSMQKTDDLLPIVDEQQTDSLVSPEQQTNNTPHVASSNHATSTNAGSIAAADADIIEKEWVDRAKQIVNKTINDPHQQQNMLNNMKADYMKTRFNKDIKQSKVQE